MRLRIQYTQIDCALLLHLAFAGVKDGLSEELAVMAESGMWPVCIPRDALQSSTTNKQYCSFIHSFIHVSRNTAVGRPS